MTRDELLAALSDPTAEDTIAEGLASGELIVINLNTVSPGGLRWVSFDAELWGEGLGCWALGTGFVILKE
jgi:hypothetical protein